ncbi:DUF3329 domain-containing protein [Aestuariivirga sp.]|uniref:DUF3329 domain-containing protein n=1 Tax=Aestuariivirga sp. TaxID=2650926 RepID=UPI00391B4EA3
MAGSEQKHPFYKPLWRRIAIVAVVAAWLALEIYRGSESLWIMIAAGMLAYAVYTFFIAWPKDAPEGDAGPEA